MKYELYVSGIGFVGHVNTIKEAKAITAMYATETGTPHTFTLAKL